MSQAGREGRISPRARKEGATTIPTVYTPAELQQWWRSLMHTPTSSKPSTSEKELIYRRFTDSFRLRCEREYLFSGKARGVYCLAGAGDVSPGKRGEQTDLFAKHITTAKRRGALPTWWTNRSTNEVMVFATKEDEWANIHFAVSERQLQGHYGAAAANELKQLRQLYTIIYGRCSDPPAITNEVVIVAEDRFDHLLTILERDTKTIVVASTSSGAFELADAVAEKRLVLLLDENKTEHERSWLLRLFAASDVKALIVTEGAFRDLPPVVAIEAILHYDTPASIPVLIARSMRISTSTSTIIIFVPHAATIAADLLKLLEAQGSPVAPDLAIAAAASTSNIPYERSLPLSSINNLMTSGNSPQINRGRHLYKNEAGKSLVFKASRTAAAGEKEQQMVARPFR